MSRRLNHFLPSIAQLLFVVLVLHMALNLGQTLLLDCDTGIHIRAGEHILGTRSMPKSDPFSFFTPPMPWPTHEWLSAVIMALVAKMGGLSAVVLFFVFMIALMYSAFYRVLRANNGNIVVDIVLIVIVLIISQIHWLARPHMFTLLLLIAWYYVLESFQNDRKNFLYCLPPIMLLWINLHGGFVLGFITITIYLLYNLVQSYRSETPENLLHARKAKYLFLATVASGLVSLINPEGFHALLFPFHVVSNRLIVDNYGEFLSPNFHNAAFTPFRYLLLGIIAYFGIFRVRLNFIDLTLILIFLNMSLFSSRYIPLFVIIVAPILSKHLNISLKQTGNKFACLIVQKAKIQQAIDERAKGYVWPIVAVMLVIFLAASNRISFTFDETTKPVAAVEFLKTENFTGNMFNENEFGDYIIYSAYPGYKVFFDSRADIYGDEKLQDYLDIVRMNPGWGELFDKYNINWVMLSSRSALSQYLFLSHDWIRVYADNVANIFVRNTATNEYLIKKYGNSGSSPKDRD